MDVINATRRVPTAITLALAVVMLVLGGLAISFLGRGQHLESVFVQDSHKAQLVSRLRADLYDAAQAEKSAVLAETDEASVDFAQQARVATDKVAAGLAEYKGMVGTGTKEGELLSRFEEAFAEYRKVDEDVLRLAVQNTNLKALALSFGPATADLANMEQALKPFVEGKQANPAEAMLAQRALIEALRIQALHAPHIEEKSDAGMDALEVRIKQADSQARAALDGLAALAGRSRLAPALAAYEQHQRDTTEILRLSRLNTNVYSLALSLGRKVKVLAACDEALQALKAYQDEELHRHAPVLPR